LKRRNQGEIPQALTTLLSVLYLTSKKVLRYMNRRRKVNVSIYALLNPINNSVFYIGATTCSLKHRLIGHCASRHQSHTTKIASYIKEIFEQGNKPEIIHLDECCFKEASYWEDFYIGLFKSFGFPINQRKSTYTSFYASKYI
jgi:hypothetical protein